MAERVPAELSACGAAARRRTISSDRRRRAGSSSGHSADQATVGRVDAVRRARWPRQRGARASVASLARRGRLVGLGARRRRAVGPRRRPSGSAVVASTRSTWATRRVDRRLDAVEHRLRVDAEEHDERRAAGPSPAPSGQRQLAEARVVARRARRGRPAGRPTAGRGRRGSRRWRPTTAHQRRVRNEPSRMRNSPTKPLRPGRPIDDSITTVNTPAKIGADLLQALELGDLAGVAALVDHPDEEEQGAGGDAVVDHLQDASPRGPGW